MIYMFIPAGSSERSLDDFDYTERLKKIGMKKVLE